MKTLVLITSQFPFGTGESFIVPEFEVLVRNFEKIIIIAQNTSGKKTRNTPGNVTIFRYNTATSITGYLYLPLLFILNYTIILKLFREELMFRKSISYHITFRNHLILIKKIIKAVQLKTFISKRLSEEGVNDSIVFYSYWLKSGAQAVALLNYRNSIKISRAHGSDIYEEKSYGGYLPLLKFSALNLDAIFFVSNQGKQYFKQKAKMESPQFIVSYLGTDNPYNKNTETAQTEKFVIVSCSNLVPLKRIDMIINSLELVETDRDLLWLHFGDGILKNEIESLAVKKLGKSDKIKYRFMGYYPNDELLKFYGSNQIDLFVNTSSTEGVPVSMMEAQSFGIPVIATDTGGVNELVTHETGSLLPVDFIPSDLANLIRYYTKLSGEERSKIRMNAFINWKLKFNASSNYADFIMKLNSIFASVTEKQIIKFNEDRS